LKLTQQREFEKSLDDEKLRNMTLIALFSSIPRKHTKIHSNEESHTPTSLRHREKIGRIASLRVF
tara:strand:- start:131 stop:325 length:195 start_codon:yes stop_codon:yes gene_type:complete